MTTEQVTVRPYARLLTMLGEQLIKNDRVALVELIKNSYDADARIVRVNFVAFSDSLETRDGSMIRISDDGSGMSERVVREQWMNPATPGKLLEKNRQPFTSLGRVMQGEKGIGRYAIFKLGRKAEVVTRAQGSNDEIVVTYDISMLDEEHLLAAADDQPVTPASMYLDQLPVTLEIRRPVIFEGTHASGTRITVSGLRGLWTDAEFEAAYKDVVRLTPLKWGESALTVDADDFRVDFLREGKLSNPSQSFLADVDRLISERSVLKVEHGTFDPVERTMSFDLNGERQVLSVDSAELRGIKAFKDRFVSSKSAEAPVFTCGPFSFAFYIFDLSPKVPAQYKVDSDERTSLRQHRIYLYRDGIRVLPYGDPEDDWLQIDVARGTQSAGRTFSNDQTIGYVQISRTSNPQLRDKTNREGLIDTGRATGDFVALIQSILGYLRTKPYAKYVLDNHAQYRRRSPVASLVGRLQTVSENAELPPKLRRDLGKLTSEYESERDYLLARAERTEDLAGVGLSVEAASHDIISSANEALRVSRRLKEGLGHLTGIPPHVREASVIVVDRLEFVGARLQDIQGLFVSTRQKRAPQDLPAFVRRVAAIYRSVIQDANVTVEYLGDLETFRGVSTDAALLQMLIQLFDNAIYWMVTSSTRNRIIRVAFDAELRTMSFSDNGPGVRDEDRPYIFEPFFSGKGEAGKGLGLYIAREVGERNGFSIEEGPLADAHGSLTGATFVVRFAK